MEHLLLHALATLTLLLLVCDPIISTTDEVVLDVAGDPLIRSEKYYIIPHSIQNGGGLTWSIKKEISFCPHFYVTPLEEKLNSGNYTSFFPSNPNLDNITISSDLNIKFTDVLLPHPWYCLSTSSFWQVTADPDTGLLFVALGGSNGNKKDIKSWFKIEKHEVDGYKIKYCPSNGVFLGDVVCGDLGIVDGYGGSWLGMNSKNPLAVVFKKHAFVEKA